jgi:hypothetical protein
MQMNYAFGSHGYNDPTGVWPVQGEWGTAILTKYRIRGIQNVQVEYINKWAKRSLLDAEIEIDSARRLHVVSLHYLPSDQGLPNTVAHLRTVAGPVIVMGDFNMTGILLPLTALGLQDTDSLDVYHQIDRIFYPPQWYRLSKYGTISDSIPWVSDHPANYAVLRIN